MIQLNILAGGLVYSEAVSTKPLHCKPVELRSFNFLGIFKSSF
jgi:hypothetical protein